MSPQIAGVDTVECGLQDDRPLIGGDVTSLELGFLKGCRVESVEELLDGLAATKRLGQTIIVKNHITRDVVGIAIRQILCDNAKIIF